MRPSWADILNQEVVGAFCFVLVLREVAGMSLGMKKTWGSSFACKRKEREHFGRFYEWLQLQGKQESLAWQEDKKGVRYIRFYSPQQKLLLNE